MAAKPLCRCHGIQRIVDILILQIHVISGSPGRSFPCEMAKNIIAFPGIILYGSKFIQCTVFSGNKFMLRDLHILL